MTTVLHVLEALEGGTARHVVDVVRHAHGVHHEVVVPPRRIGGITDDTAVEAMTAAGATVHALAMTRSPWSPANAMATARLARLIRRQRPDIVHGHSSIGGLLARVAATGSGLPVVYTPNGITQVRVGILAERALARRTTRLIAVSASEAALALSLRLATAEHVVMIPNGIDLSPPPAFVHDLRSQLGAPPDAPLVGTIARLVPQKDPLCFVRACAFVHARLPDAHFVMIGSGPLASHVDDEVGRSGLSDRFHRVANLPGARAAVGQLDVFALSSRFEGGPYTPLEAMLAGTPVVVTDAVGSVDAVQDGVSGLVVPRGDASSLGAAVLALLTDRARGRDLAAHGSERVRRLFDVEDMGARTAALYASLVAHR